MKTKFMLIILAGLLLIGIVSACTCPLDENDYDQVIEINQWLISSNPTVFLGRHYEHNSGIISLDNILSAGEYEITLVSRDYYPTRSSTDSTTQQNEQYYIKFISGCSFVAKTDSINDLEDGVNSDENIEIVETNLYLPAGTNSLQAFHSVYPDSNPNSLEAVCVGIKKVDEPPTCGPGTDDYDCDYVPNNEDNCKYVWNPNQADCDGDGKGDVCDSNNECEEEPEQYCGDGICNGDETCSSCPADCGVCPVEPECGNGIIEEGEECDGEEGCLSNCKWEDDDDDKRQKTPFEWNFCESNWKCSGWSECLEGIMTRQCIDENHCEIEYNKPYEQTGCSSISKVYVEETPNYIWVLVGVIIFIILLIILINLLR